MFAALEGSVLGLHVPVAEALVPTGGSSVVDILDAPLAEVSVVPEAAISVVVILRGPVFACVVVILDVSVLPVNVIGAVAIVLLILVVAILDGPVLPVVAAQCFVVISGSAAADVPVAAACVAALLVAPVLSLVALVVGVRVPASEPDASVEGANALLAIT